MENEFKILFLECLAYKIKYSLVKKIKLALIAVEKVMYIWTHRHKNPVLHIKENSSLIKADSC